MGGPTKLARMRAPYQISKIWFIYVVDKNMEHRIPKFQKIPTFDDLSSDAHLKCFLVLVFDIRQNDINLSFLLLSLHLLHDRCVAVYEVILYFS